MSAELSTVDTSGLEEHVDLFMASLRERFGEYAKRFQVELAESIRRHIDPQANPVGQRSTSSRIGSAPGRGGIWDALTLGNPANIYHEEITDAAVQIDYGISQDLVPWVWVHELGGTIRPRSAKALAIPVSEQAVAALNAAGGDLRALDLFIIEREGKAPVLAHKNGGEIEVWFVLAPQVTIPARPYWNPGISDFEQLHLPNITGEIEQDLQRLWHAV